MWAIDNIQVLPPLPKLATDNRDKIIQFSMNLQCANSPDKNVWVTWDLYCHFYFFQHEISAKNGPLINKEEMILIFMSRIVIFIFVIYFYLPHQIIFH